MDKEGEKAVTVSVVTRLKSIEDIEPVDRPAELNRLGKLIMAELEKTSSIPRALGEVASSLQHCQALPLLRYDCLKVLSL